MGAADEVQIVFAEKFVHGVAPKGIRHPPVVFPPPLPPINSEISSNNSEIKSRLSVRKCHHLLFFWASLRDRKRKATDRYVFVGVGPEQVAEEAVVGDVGGTGDALYLLQRLQLW